MQLAGLSVFDLLVGGSGCAGLQRRRHALEGCRCLLGKRKLAHVTAVITSTSPGYH